MAGGRNSGRRPNNAPQTDEQIVATAKIRARSNTTLARTEEARTANEESIGRIVQFASEGIQNVIQNGGRVRLDDAEAVKAITWHYLEVCSNNGMIPTMTGLSMAIGCTIHALNDHKRRHPDSETSAWLRYVKDIFAEILAQSMLNGKTVPIPSIFMLQAKYNWNDTPADDLDDNAETDKTDARTIMEKYSDLPE